MSPDSTLDPGAIELLRSLGTPGDPDDFLREVVALFLADAPVRLAEMDAALQAGDRARFTRSAHSLKGSAANIGAVAVKTVAGVLEQRSREAGLDGLAPVAEELRREFERTRDRFQQLVGAAPSPDAQR